MVQGEWDEGLLQIASSRGAHPATLLQFFPSLLPHPGAALAALPPSHRSARAVSADGGGAHGTSAAQGPFAAQGSEQASGAEPRDGSASGGTQQGAAAPSRQTPGAPASPSVAAVIPYLITLRSRLMAQGSRDSSTHATTDSASTARGPTSTPSAPAAAAAASDRQRFTSGGSETREMIDLALVRGWLQVHDYGALLRLLQQPNHLPLEEGAETLHAAGAYRELVRPRTSRCFCSKSASRRTPLPCASVSFCSGRFDSRPRGASWLKRMPGYWLQERPAHTLVGRNSARLPGHGSQH